MAGEKLRLIILSLAFITELTVAQNSTASFLYWQPSAKSYSMGGIGSALSNDIYSAYYNPSGLAFSKRITITGSFVKPFPFLGNIANSFFGISYKVDNSNTLGFSANLFWMGKQIRTLESSPEPVVLVAIGIKPTPMSLSSSQSPNIFCLSSRRCWASSESVAVGRASRRPTPMASPVSSQ